MKRGSEKRSEPLAAAGGEEGLAGPLEDVEAGRPLRPAAWEGPGPPGWARGGARSSKSRACQMLSHKEKAVARSCSKPTGERPISPSGTSLWVTLVIYVYNR